GSRVLADLTITLRLTRIAVDLLLQTSDTPRQLRLNLLDPRLAAHRVPAGRGAYLSPIGDHFIEVEQTFLDQRRQATAHQLIEELAALDPERRQDRMVDANPAASPAVDHMILAQPRHCPRRADAFQCRIQP